MRKIGVKKLLLISYYFPPLGLAGVTRARHLFRLLPEFGWESHILTVKPIAYRGFEPELLEGLDQTRIHRCGSYDPQRIMHLLGFSVVKAASIEAARPVSSLFFPDSKIGWVGPAIRMAKRLHAQLQFDAVMSTSPPVSAHLVGLSVSTELQIPWIADFRDPWTTRTIDREYRSKRHRSKAEALLRAIRKQASAITAVTNGVGAYVGATDIVFNAFSTEHTARWTAQSDPAKFRIGLLGTIAPNQVEPLCRLLSHLMQREPLLRSRIVADQVGTAHLPELREAFASCGVDDLLQAHGRLSREETIRLLANSSLMYLGVSKQHDQMVLTSRLFDLLASGRPLLISAPDQSDLAEFAASVSTARVSSQPDLLDQLDWVVQLIRSHQAGELRFAVPPDHALPYADSELARKISAILERITLPGA